MGYALVGSKPRSSEHAGNSFPVRDLGDRVAAKYPESVRFTLQGFPDFSPYAIATVTLEDLTGSRTKDFKIANEMAGYAKTPSGFTWHHIEDGHTLVLVPTALHNAVPHTGGIALDQNIKDLQTIFTIGALGSILSSSTDDNNSTSP
jgi:filamentous hemagglutinin